VHCHAGISRSASLVINYFRHHMRMPLSEVRERRPEVHPNHSFMLQLLGHERRCSPEGDSSLTETDLAKSGGFVKDCLVSHAFKIQPIQAGSDSTCVLN
jgi:hypothetical protein